MVAADRDPAETKIEHALKEGDFDHALSLLMATYGKELFRFCLSFLRDYETAEDVHQTTFVQAYKALKGSLRPDSFRAWLYRVCRNRCLDTLKTSRRRERRIQLTDMALEAVDDGPSFQEKLEKRETDRALMACLEKLKLVEREAVLLNYLSGFSFAEIARMTGGNPPAVRARVVRALPKLRRCIESRGIRR